MQRSPDGETLPGRSRRRLLSGPTVLLFALLVGVGGFLVGVQVEKDNSSGASAIGGAGGGGGARLRALLAAGGGFTGAGAGGGRGGAAAGAARGAGGATIGQVASVDNGTLYVTSAAGGTVAVHTTASSQVTRTVDASARDVHPGEQVIVRGTRAPDGSIDAISVTANATAAGALGSLATAGGGSAGGGAAAAGGGGGGFGGPPGGP